MKSAYELAMERLERDSGPTRKLSEEQKARIADIDKQFDARAAETRLGYDEKVAANPAEAAALREEMAVELQRIEEKREREKEAVWNEG